MSDVQIKLVLCGVAGLAMVFIFDAYVRSCKRDRNKHTVMTIKKEEIDRAGDWKKP